jgi:hypothetical protein
MMWRSRSPRAAGDLEMLERRIRETMLQHHIALGCWGIPDGARPTFSRAEFYGLARELGACSQEEYERLHRHLHLIWLRDLSD